MFLPYYLSVYVHATEIFLLYIAYHLHITLSKCPSHISLRIILQLVSQGRNAGKHACIFKLNFSVFICSFLCQCSGFVPLYRVG